MSAALLSYLFGHFAARNIYLESSTVGTSIENAVGLYQVRPDPKTHELGLFLDGEDTRSLPTDESGPLGIGKLTSARGLFSRSQALIDGYNDAVSDFILGFTNHFYRDPETPDTINIRLRAIDENLAPANPAAVLRIKAGNFNPITDLPTGDRGIERVRALLGSGDIYDPTQPVASAEDMVSEPAAREKTTDPVRDAITAITTEVDTLRIELGSKRLTTITNDTILDAFGTKVATLRRPVEEVFGSNIFSAGFNSRAGFGCGFKMAPDRCPLDAPDVELRCLVAGIACIERYQYGELSPFHRRLVDIVEADLTFFWTFGPWRWAEIVMLCWLGVLVEGLTRLGVQYAGRDPDGLSWEPRESTRTLLKLSYAPPLCMIVIWMLFMTDILDSETRVTDSFAGFIPIAFMLGLFPNLGYSLLERTARTIFHRTSVAAPRKRPEPKERTERGTAPAASDERPDFSEFKAAIRRATTAPLRND